MEPQPQMMDDTEQQAQAHQAPPAPMPLPSPRVLNALFPHLAHIPAALAPEALLDAVNEGSVQLVADLVRRDPSLANHRDGFGQTPLMWAAYKGRADMVGCLLDCGAGVNECETRRARTALYLACEFDHADVVALLLRRGADQRLPAQRGWTVLSRGFEGWTPLIIAGYNGCPAVLRCLLAHPDAGELLDKGDEKGATALWWAAVHNRPDAVRVLLEAGADFLKGNDEGKTPCEAARERGNAECTALLEAAERAYLMTKSRRLSRESEAWARLLHTQLLPSLGLPAYLQARVALDTAALPRARPPTPALLQALIRSEEEDENENGSGGVDMMLLQLEDGDGDAALSKGSSASSSYNVHSHKQDGLKVQEQEHDGGYDSAGSSDSKGSWYAAPLDPMSSSLSMSLDAATNANAAYATPLSTPGMSTAEAEAQEFADWRWGRPAPHYAASRSSSGGSMGSGASSFLSRAVSSAFGGSSSSSSSSGGGGGGGGSYSSSTSSLLLGGSKKGVVPDGGDDAEAAASLDQLLPQAVAHYINRRMRYDVFLQVRDMLTV